MVNTDTESIPDSLPDTSKNSPQTVFSYPWRSQDWAISQMRLRLDAAGRGVYRELLDLCYSQGSMPADHKILARHCAVSDEEFARIWKIIRSKFRKETRYSDKYNNKTATAWRSCYFQRLYKQRQNGAKGGRPPNNGNKDIQRVGLDLANPDESGGFDLANPNLTQTKPKEKEKEKEKERSLCISSSAVKGMVDTHANTRPEVHFGLVGAPNGGGRSYAVTNWDWFKSKYPAHRLDEERALRAYLSIVTSAEVEVAVCAGLEAALKSADWQRGCVWWASKFLSEGLFGIKYQAVEAPYRPQM